MTETTKEYPNYVRTIRRKDNRFSIVQRWCLRLFWTFVILLAVIVIYSLISYGVKSTLDMLIFAPLISLFVSFIFCLNYTGSLVESVKVDYVHQEVRFLRYTLFFQQRESVIPFKGLYWNVMPGGPFAFNRLRIFLKDGKRVVIVENVLGWDETEFAQLESALSKIVEKEY